MEPPPASRIGGITDFMPHHVPNTLIRCVRSRRSKVSSSKGSAVGSIAALFTSPSTRPKARSAVATTRSQSSPEVTSASTKTAPSPSPSATCLPFSP